MVDYKTMMAKISMRMEELEKKVQNETPAPTSAPSSRNNDFQHEEQDVRMPDSNSPEVEAQSSNTNNQGPPVLTGEDVNTSGLNSHHELDEAPLAFVNEDINMSGQPVDGGRPGYGRFGKQRKRLLDEDEEDFGFDQDFGVDGESGHTDENEDGDKDDDSDRRRVSIVQSLSYVADCLIGNASGSE
jgi:hypothetical protein